MTQNEMVLQYMQDFGNITPLKAFQDLGILRLAARIKDLTDRGVKISRSLEFATNRYGKKVRYMRYWLEESE